MKEMLHYYFTKKIRGQWPGKYSFSLIYKLIVIWLQI